MTSTTNLALLLGGLLFLLLPRSSSANHDQYDVFADEYDSGSCVGYSETDQFTGVEVLPGIVTSVVTEPVQISWTFPRGICGEGYLVSFTPDDTAGDPVYFSLGLDQRSVVVPSSGLVPGAMYTIKLELEYAKGKFTNAFSLNTVPVAACAKDRRPGAPTGLHVKKSEGGTSLNNDVAEVCWSLPDDPEAGCPDEYTLAIRRRPDSPSDLFDKTHGWRFEKRNRAGCHRISGLDAGDYDIGVRAYSAGNQTSGDVTLISTYLTARWTCIAGDDMTSNRGDNAYYEWCDAAKNAECTPMSCTEVAASGMCGHPSVRRFDPERATVVQYCASSCGCSDATPSALDLDRTGDDDPRVCCRAT